ncbi:hypothetical protein COCHEDRAFT_1066882, partial [Bipolaris maydis C5]
MQLGFGSFVAFVPLDAWTWALVFWGMLLPSWTYSGGGPFSQRELLLSIICQDTL